MKNLCRQTATLEEPTGTLDIHHNQTYSAPETLKVRYAPTFKEIMNNDGTTTQIEASIWFVKKSPKKNSIVTCEGKKFKIEYVNEFRNKTGKLVGCRTLCSTDVLHQK
jgi:hypothetical protein